MRGRLPALLLLGLIVLIQYPLWLGKGGWLHAWKMEAELAGQRERNAGLESRNIALEAEVKDLRLGFDAVEEHARTELGLVKPDEIFVQVARKQP